MKNYITKHTHSALANVYRTGITAKLRYINDYQKLEDLYGKPKLCKKIIERELLNSYQDRMKSQLDNDMDSKLGTYLRVNPNLKSYVPNPQTIMEYERFRHDLELDPILWLLKREGTLIFLVKIDYVVVALMFKQCGIYSKTVQSQERFHQKTATT